MPEPARQPAVMHVAVAQSAAKLRSPPAEEVERPERERRHTTVLDDEVLAVPRTLPVGAGRDDRAEAGFGLLGRVQ